MRRKREANFAECRQKNSPTPRRNREARGESGSVADSLPHSKGLWGVEDAAEADGAAAVAAGGHQEEFFVGVEAIGLREIPDGA